MNIHELMVQKYLNSVVAGEGGMSRPVLDFMVNDVKLALEKQLVDKRNPDFRLRMSNIGRSYCQLGLIRTSQQMLYLFQTAS